MVFFSSRISPFTSTVIAWKGRRATAVVTSAMRALWLVKCRPWNSRCRSSPPGAGDALDIGLTTELAFGAHSRATRVTSAATN